MAPLAEYRRKRDPAATPEPFGDGSGQVGGQPIFVVQRHAARQLHFDFRLERDGVLASWVLPKGVPLEPGERRLAVHVEDHPLEYARFEGEIPAGQYGAGRVEIWDSGTYELIGEKPDGSLIVRLNGQRLQGAWALVPAALSGDPENWLIVRKREQGLSASGTPRQYAPMLATLSPELPQGEGWLFELKWDGYRALADVHSGGARLLSRNGNNLTGRFPRIAEALPKAVRVTDCVLDGEICALDRHGRASFSALQQARPGTRYVYFVFDLLELAGEPLVDLPLVERRARLERLLDRRSRTIVLSEAFNDGGALLAAAREQGLEGVMAKRADSPYLPGKRTRFWLKVKTRNRQEFLITGYTRGRGSRSGSLGALVLAVRNEQGELVYVGNCGTGFSEQTLADLLSRVHSLERATAPFPVPPRMPRVRRGDVVWVEPKLVAEVEFAEWTHDGHLRTPVFLGLREDKSPDEVRREEPPIPPELRRGRRVVLFSNLDKLFWPEEGITKGDLLRYYRDVAPVLVPHLRDRPFTMKRYPDGWQGKHFFQKDAPRNMPEWIKRIPVSVTPRETPRQTRVIHVPVVDDELALLWMINMGCIDCNTWYSRLDRLDRPDWVVFDLDPSAGVGVAETVEVALLVRQELEALELTSFPKTSGATGLHILAPIERRQSYDETRSFAAVVADTIARAHPGLATTEWSKQKRRGVLIDANQNAQGKTIASVYSVRAMPGAPVSTPLRWDELDEKLNPSAFTMEVVLERIRLHGDLYQGVLTTRQRLSRVTRARSATSARSPVV